MSLLMWWNACNLFDDQNDPHYQDIVRSTDDFHRDLREIAEVLAAQEPAPDFIGLGEIENKNVLNQLIQELRWHPKHRGFSSQRYINSKDPRGIDLAYLQKDNGSLRVNYVREAWPQHKAAVRSVLVLHCRLYGLPLRIALIHSKSRRSGDRHHLDPMPGSALRFSYGRLLRQLAVDAGSDHVPFIAIGDFNDQPNSPSLTHGANAYIGRNHKQINPLRLYNLSNECLADAPGSHCYHGHWAMLDQILVNGYMLQAGGLSILGRPRLLTAGPLLYNGEPNRWYSDHLPLAVDVGIVKS